MDKTLIIIPTYNEAKNIEELCAGIKKFSPKKDILFVDDSSGDGTIQIIKRIMEKDTTINILIREKKEGVAKAYLAGFRWGLNRDYEWFQQMDADLTHNPGYLPVIDRFKSDYDVIIASRYIKEGEVKKWNPVRKFLSYFGCLYLKLIFGNTINDLTGGFNCWRREVLQNIDFSKIISSGFIFQTEMKFSALMSGFKIVEFPYIYKERKRGKSKFSLGIFIEGLIKPYLIRFKYPKPERR